MKIQRFEGKDLQEALRLAQIALGPDAVILQTRRVPGTGMMRLVGKLRVEVLAAVDLSPSVAGPPRGASTSKNSPSQTPSASPIDHGPASCRSADAVRFVEDHPKADCVRPPASRVPAASPPPTSWSNELAALRLEMSGLRRDLSQAIELAGTPRIPTAADALSVSDYRFQSKTETPKS